MLFLSPPAAYMWCSMLYPSPPHGLQVVVYAVSSSPRLLHEVGPILAAALTGEGMLSRLDRWVAGEEGRACREVGVWGGKEGHQDYCFGHDQS